LPTFLLSKTLFVFNLSYKIDKKRKFRFTAKHVLLQFLNGKRKSENSLNSKQYDTKKYDTKSVNEICNMTQHIFKGALENLSTSTFIMYTSTFIMYLRLKHNLTFFT